VLRFSIGFGRPLLRLQRAPDATEYVLAGIPLGGYVKMLDEREGEVPADQLHLAFNRQVLWKRVAIVAAGPVFNLIFAVGAYWLVFMGGDLGLKPVIAEVAPDSIAAEAGFEPGDELLRVGDRESPTWEGAVFAFAAQAIDGGDLAVRVKGADGLERDRLIPADRLAGLEERPDLMDRLGLTPQRPRIPAVIGELVAGGAAERAGLEVGDRVVAVDGEPVSDWHQWVDLVRGHPGRPLNVEVQRGDGPVEIAVTPEVTESEGERIGRIGAIAEQHDEPNDRYLVEVRYGPLDALGAATHKTFDMAHLMLKVMGRMLVGQASVDNLSGPITIAEAAGRTASYGLDPFLKFLAVVSVSLGVLNLLPIPVLDGGHLLYFFIEWVKGSPLSEAAQIQGQKVGIAILAALMTLAFYVDLSRVLS
jgi:regulator of sigma E protease